MENSEILLEGRVEIKWGNLAHIICSYVERKWDNIPFRGIENCIIFTTGPVEIKDKHYAFIDFNSDVNHAEVHTAEEEDRAVAEVGFVEWEEIKNDAGILRIGCELPEVKELLGELTDYLRQTLGITPYEPSATGAPTAGQETDATQIERDPFKAEEDAKRKEIVKRANRLKTATKTWIQVADELDVPERTLRDWRHNPRYR